MSLVGTMQLSMLTFSVLRQRLDSFTELVASSIEYAESTSHQLHPSKKGPLNGPLLKKIHDLTRGIREMQAFKASGATNPKPIT